MNDHGTRTSYEAILDARYRIRLNELCCRYYRSLRFAINFIAITSGLSAVTVALESIPKGVLLAGIVVAVCAVVDVLANFTEKAVKHDYWREEFVDLLSRKDALTLQEFDAEMHHIDKHVNNEVELLRLPAWNDNMRRCGHEDWVRPESFTHKLMRVFA